MEVILMIKAGMTSAGLELAEAEDMQITNAAISEHGYRGYMVKIWNICHAIQSWNQSSVDTLSAVTRTNKT